MRCTLSKLLALGLGASLLSSLVVVFSTTEAVKKPVEESIQVRQQTQKEEEKWRDDKDDLAAKMDSLQLKIKELTARRTDLADKVKAAEERIVVKEKQLADSEAIRAKISPLISSMIDDLQAFDAKDLPFLAEERKNRLQHLVELRDDPEVPVSEKFRKVLEAMLVETEYGNSIEVYQQDIAVDGQDRLVNIFRLGRVCLFYQTVDQKGCGFYNMATGSWQPFEGQYNRAIGSAIEIGAKRRPVELLTLPLGRIQPQ
jgi:hypothetical protein